MSPVWILQDFVQEMPDSVAHTADPATAWLRPQLQVEEAELRRREYILYTILYMLQER